MSASPSTLPVVLAGFTTNAPTAADATWRTIRWRKLPAADTLARVISVVRWKGGFVALGDDVGTIVTARTPMWASTDGVTWKPVDPSVFGPSTLIIGVAAVPNGLVAVTVRAGASMCEPGDTVARLCFALDDPLQSWTSTDGVTWTAQPGPGLPALGDGPPPLFAGGPGGLLVYVDDGTRRTFARSVDGIAWTDVPSASLPKLSGIRDLRATPTGFTVIGYIGQTHAQVAVARSTDGRAWTVSRLPYIAGDKDEFPDGFIGASHGFIVTGESGLTGGSDGPFWWRSGSGQTWQALTTFAPLGVHHVVEEEAPGDLNLPDGSIGGDGTRMVAIRWSTIPIAWTSTDGATWHRIAMAGSVPDSPTVSLVLPMGVLCVTPDGAWFGEASTQ